MNETTETYDSERLEHEAAFERSLRSNLHESMRTVRVAGPPADAAWSVLRRAEQTRRRRQHRSRALVALAIVLLIVTSAVGLTRSRTDSTRGVDAGAAPTPTPGSDVSGTTPVSSVVPPTTAGAPTAPTAPSSDGVPRVVLPGWTTANFSTIDSRDGSPSPTPYVEYQFTKGTQRLQLSFYPEAELTARAEHGVDEVGVRGTSGHLLDYGTGRYRVDFLEGGRTWEADGSPFPSREAFLAAVDAIQGADDATWKASLPANAVTADTRFETVEQILVQVPIPPGFDVEALKARSLPNNRYDLTAHVLGSVECAWIRRWLDAPSDTTQRPQAVAALGGVDRWPALRAMRTEGAYPDVAAEYAQRAVRGDRAGLAGYEQALGC